MQGRDINRIDKIVDKLTYLWKMHPDLRFWQLIMVVTKYLDKAVQNDPFYVEEDKWLSAIESAIKENSSVEQES